MNRRQLLTAAAFAAAVPLLPLAAAAQTGQTTQTAQAQSCPGAIKAVEQRLQEVKQRDDWNRVQVQLYIAEQFLAEGQPKSCMGAVQEARAILGMKTPPQQAAAGGTAATGATQATGQSAARKNEDEQESAGGSNIGGVQPEGWGTNEAQPVGGTQRQTSDTAAASQEQAGPSRVPASDLIGKTVKLVTGEPIGKVADVTEKSPGPQRVVIATGEAKIAVAPSALRYDRSNDVVVVDITEAQLQDALAASGGETAAETGTKMGTATQKE